MAINIIEDMTPGMHTNRRRLRVNCFLKAIKYIPPYLNAIIYAHLILESNIYELNFSVMFLSLDKNHIQLQWN